MWLLHIHSDSWKIHPKLTGYSSKYPVGSIVCAKTRQERQVNCITEKEDEGKVVEKGRKRQRSRERLSQGRGVNLSSSSSSNVGLGLLCKAVRGGN